MNEVRDVMSGWKLIDEEGEVVMEGDRVRDFTGVERVFKTLHPPGTHRQYEKGNILCVDPDGGEMDFSPTVFDFKFVILPKGS